ncbi:hypothetical protein [Phenylobacterium sp.]|uniref:hypothetical protein n=1 Tax=Phenylobacterium sp. TaxID=1871053 RepID=UPI0012181B1B|nr:hypothetical protein [Phenylobacterium sp.]THD63525.1 MAG: hypothetical protein E8A49_05100 [Phenylobacterium sp.]
MTARAVTPTAQAPSLQDQPPPAPVPHIATAVALGPAAMTALMQAQEQLSATSPATVRTETAQTLGRLLYDFDGDADDAPPPPAGTAAPLPVLQLKTTQQALYRSLIDLRA